ncbi:unnamed protein product [Linum trigynum]|uniref:Homeobox-leucine zipper protein n=1 Tax=Linum trigynum TaxID=586398 RepID=A0AAV2GSN9_9ROSI
MANNPVSGGFVGFGLLSCDPLWIPPPSVDFHGERHMVDFDNVGCGDAMDGGCLFHSLVKEELCDEDFELGSSPRGKKRRLTISQVQSLERSFEMENKLEPERKVQLAQELGLQPRQVAIWFQNRRARFKNKQLERDFDSLRANFDRLKADYSSLLHENETLKNQVNSLKEKLGVKGNLTNSGGTATFLVPAAIVPPPPMKPEEAAAAAAKKSDPIINSDSPHSVLMEATESSQVFEENQSDYFSQDEDDTLHNNNNNSNELLMMAQQPINGFPKFNELPGVPNPCGFEFPVEDQPFLVLDSMNWM